MSIFEALLLSYLVNSLWQVPLLYAAAWLAARAFRPLGVAAQHRIWVAALLLQSILPALSALPSSWLRAVLSWFAGARSAGSAHVTVTLGPGTAFSPIHLPPHLLATIAASAAGRASPPLAGRSETRSRRR